MPLELTVETSNEATDLLDQLRQAMSGQKLHTTLAESLKQTLQKHFREKDTVGNKFNASNRSHLWGSIAAATHRGPITDTSGQVIVADNEGRSGEILGHKIAGGWIDAVNSDYLTIPGRAEAYNTAASVLESRLGVEFFVVRTDNWLLLGANEDGQFVPYYILVQSVFQPADATALPPEDQVQDAFVHQLNRILTLVQRRNNAPQA